MSDKHYDDQEKDIRTLWFKNHIAEFSDQGMFKTLEWHEPSTSNYWCRFIISKRTLIVYGDCGDAIFQWSDALTWEWIAGLDLHYFEGKCQASEYGRHYETWDSNTAKDWCEDFLKHCETQDTRKAFEENDGWEQLNSRDEWIQFLHEHGYEIFGDDLSSVSECGDRIDIRCKAT